MKKAFIDYLLHLGDNTLILGHRNSEWCGHGPVLEQDIAITNISLDLIGQARNFYQYAAQLKGDGSTEDSLAYLRDVSEFKNCLLTEQPNGDWARTILRQFFFSVHQFYLYQGLSESKDQQLAAIAEKSLKEIVYHLRWSSEWVIRLGDGTKESRERMLTAINDLWMLTDELFEAVGYEQAAVNIDHQKIKEAWSKKVKEVFDEATLALPQNGFQKKGGKEGSHTEHLGQILADLQFMQRTYPGCEW